MRMSIFPITPLVGRVKTLILATFDVAEQQAEDYAAEMVALAEGWGSPENAWIGPGFQVALEVRCGAPSIPPA